MNDTKTAGIFSRRDRFTPRGLALRAGLLVALFGALHLCGLRDHVGFLCGSFAAGSVPREAQAALGVAYLFFWLAATVAAPILAVTAGLLWAAEKRG